MRKADWTPRQIKLLEKHYPFRPTRELVDIVGVTVANINAQAFRMGLKKDPEYLIKLQRQAIRNLIVSGKSHRIQKGNIPVNKGQKMSPELYEKVKHTFFKKGQMPFNMKPIGYERINAEGYIEVKVREERPNFEGKHRAIWKQHHGEIPTGHIIIFADGNNRNFDIENLLCVDRKDHAVRNRFRKKYGPEIAESILLLSQIKRKLKNS
jgi:hypothetical protein